MQNQEALLQEIFIPASMETKTIMAKEKNNTAQCNGHCNGRCAGYQHEENEAWVFA